jgi:hypothetical protein
MSKRAKNKVVVTIDALPALMKNVSGVLNPQPDELCPLIHVPDDLVMFLLKRTVSGGRAQLETLHKHLTDQLSMVDFAMSYDSEELTSLVTEVRSSYLEDFIIEAEHASILNPHDTVVVLSHEVEND